MVINTRTAIGALILCCLGCLFPPGCGETEDRSEAPTATVEFEPEETEGDRTTAKASTPVKARKTRVIVLADKRCKERGCETARVTKKLRSTLPGIEVVQHDWSEERCKTLFDSVGLKHLPAYLLEATVVKNPGYRKLARFLQKTPSDDLMLLKIKATFDPRAEICDNGTDDTGNGLADCRDPSCKTSVVCREEIPRRLDLFVMSMCPFGTMAMDSMSEVLDAFGRDIDFHIHFIASDGEQGLRSLHGQPEVDEDIRELCAIKHFPRKNAFMDYIWCRNRAIKESNWRKCAGTKGNKASVIERCVSSGEGEKLLRVNLTLAQELEISASPTWLANNRFVFHGIAPEVVRQNFCQHNKGLAGCQKRLSTKTPRPAGTCE